MTLDELKKIVAKELPVNKERLDTESLRGQELYAKFLDYKTNFAFLLAKANGDYKRLYREKWEYYGGKADAKVYATKPFDLKVLKTDLSVYIESDQEIIDAENKIVYLEETVKYIDGVLKAINSRGWDIKNCLEAQSLKSGLMG